MAIAAYLTATSLVSYLVWGPWDGVDPRPVSWWTYASLIVFHVVVGAAVARWRALALPLAWAAISFRAQGYDVPVSTAILLQTPFFWAPALLIGIVIRKAAARRGRGSRRLAADRTTHG